MKLALNTNNDFLNMYLDLSKKEFLSGEFLPKEKSQLIFDKISHNQCDYIQKVNYVKTVLTKAKFFYTENIMFIKTNKELSEADKAVLIRYINISKRDRYLIVLNNDELIYIPYAYHQYGGNIIQHLIQKYVSSIIKRYIKYRKYNIIKYKVKKCIRKIY